MKIELTEKQKKVMKAVGVGACVIASVGVGYFVGHERGLNKGSFDNLAGTVFAFRKDPDICHEAFDILADMIQPEDLELAEKNGDAMVEYLRNFVKEYEV